MSRQKPFSQACENNKGPILAILQPLLTVPATVLEIGCGTGQHAVHFAANLPHINWQPSDQAVYLPGSRLWINDAALPNLNDPLELDVMAEDWPISEVDAVYSANTAHIMHWPAVVAMFEGVGRVLKPGGRFVLYGPFRYSGRYTSDSNIQFDQYLQRNDPGMGLRDLDDLTALAHLHGLMLEADHAMPANNQTLVWYRSAYHST